MRSAFKNLGRALAVMVIAGMLGCGGGGGDAPTTPPPTSTAVATVELSATTVELAPGASVQLQATPRSASGAALADRAVAWNSSNAAVATVSQAGVVTGVAAGSATISATSEGRSGSASVTVAAAADPCDAVRTIVVGQPFTGTLSASDCALDDGSALQTFTFTLAAATALEIEMTSTAVDPYLFVLDATLNVLAEDDDGGAGSNARVLRTFPPGQYVVIANTFDARSFGSFQLAVRPAPAACVGGRPTTLPATVNASLTTNASCRLNDDSYYDRYELTVPARTTVKLDMSSTVVDPYLILYDAAGKLVAQDDDAGAGLDAHIEVQLEPGRYTVLANAQPSQLGAYRLQAQAAVDPCAVNRTLPIGQAVSGTLSASDCAVNSQGPTPYTQRWLLTVPSAMPLQVDMASNAVDTYLVIQDASTGAVLAENDDVSGSSTNSRIAANFPAGQYIVNATTYEPGETGAYALAATTIATTTPVSISVSQSAITLSPGEQRQLAATVTGNANTAVSWQSSSNAIVTVSNTGLVRGITPGSATITVRSAADPSKAATVNVTVAQSQTGTANLDIAAMYLIQSVQQLDGSVPLVANRDAVARVFLRGSRSGIGATTVRVRLFQGSTLLQTLQASVNPAPGVDEGCCSANILIPASLIRAGVSILADADPQNVLSEPNENDNTYPLSGTPMALNVVTVPDLNLRLVPVRQGRSGLTGVASTSVHSVLRSLWPLSTVNVTTRQPLAIDYALVGSSFDEWSMLVRDLELARRAEGSGAYYYGLVRANYTSGVLGLAGGIPALSAVGLDEGSSFGATEARLTLAHELGHAIGLRHAPCGGAAGPDPAYPFNDARTGAFGMDILSGNVIKIPTGTDIMGYCDNQWVSVYNYRNMMNLRARNPNGVAAGLVASAPSSVLMISGSVSTGAAIVDGAFAMRTLASKHDPAGRFVLEGYSAQGKVLFTHRFSPFEVSDGRPGDEAFVVGVPVDERVAAEIVRVTVREVDGTRAFTRTKRAGIAAQADLGAALAVRGTAAKRLEWSAAAAPMIVVRDPASGEVLGVGRTGSLELSQLARGASEVELLVSDGVSSVRRVMNPVTGAIRP